jgi:CBS domain-containing protein
MTEHSVSHFMVKDFPELSAETPIRRAAAILTESGFSAAPVLAADRGLIGILSQKDCFRPALNASYYREWKGTVSEYMSTDVVTVEANAELVNVANMFVDHRHRIFPATEADRVVGLVRRSAVLKLLLSLS